jgi:carbonic anhydrase
MSSATHRAGIAVTCVDCRLHAETIVPQLATLMNVDHVYVRTTAGPEARLLAPAPNSHLDSIIADLTLLIEAKAATVVAVVGHCDCAGHPVSDEEHASDVVKAADTLRLALPKTVTVIPLLAYPPKAQWVVSAVA